MNLRAWVELARLSNSPTIVSNVLVGVAIGTAGSPSPAHSPWLVASAMSLAMLLLYVAGMALNDVFDAEIDRAERPKRPIPSGRISRGAAAIFAITCLVIGVFIAGVFSTEALLCAIALAVAVVLYDALHKRVAVAAALMGACRGLVYLTAAAAVGWPLNWKVAVPLGVALTAYVLLVTIIARSEAKPRGASPIVIRLSVLLVAAALAPALWIAPLDWMYAVIAALVLIGWLIASQRHLIERPLHLPRAVMAFLAGICLVDGYYLALLEEPGMMVIAWVCFIVTIFAHRRISGT